MFDNLSDYLEIFTKKLKQEKNEQQKNKTKVEQHNTEKPENKTIYTKNNSKSESFAQLTSDGFLK